MNSAIMFLNTTTLIDIDYEFIQNSTEQEISLNDSEKFFVTIIWCLIIIVGVVANGYVVVEITFSPQVASATQYFIANLTFSDLMFLIICPPIALLNFNDFQIHHSIASFVCKLSYAMTHVIFLKILIICNNSLNLSFSLIIQRLLRLSHA